MSVSKENPYFVALVKKIGEEILRGALPFEHDQLMEICPKLVNLFDRVQFRRSKEYQQIEQLFVSQVPTPITAKQSKYLAALDGLKEYALKSYKAKRSEFSVEEITKLAQDARELTTAVLANHVTQEHLDVFQNETKRFQTNKVFKVLLATLVGIVAGMLIGFAVGSFAGAAVGAVAGGVSAALSFGLWARASDPVRKVARLAGQIGVEEELPATSMTNA